MAPSETGKMRTRGGPSIKHLDDVPSEEMLRFRLKDGRTASIWEKWIELSPNYIAFWNQWDPGAMTPHHGDHSIFMLQGEIRSRDGHICRAGSHIMLEYGDLFGPWVAGVEGATMYGFIAGYGFAYAGDNELWKRFLTENGAEIVPTPRPKRLPPWYRERGENFGRQWE